MSEVKRNFMLAILASVNNGREFIRYAFGVEDMVRPFMPALNALSDVPRNTFTAHLRDALSRDDTFPVKIIGYKDDAIIYFIP